MKYKTTSHSKWNRGWRFYLRYWTPFIIISVVLIVMCVIKIVKIDNEEKELVRVSKPFNTTYTITPESSYKTYQIPSELFEYMAIQAIQEENFEQTP